jgi:histone H3/H4
VKKISSNHKMARTKKSIEKPASPKVAEKSQTRKRKKVYGLGSSVAKLWKKLCGNSYSLSKESLETFENVAKELVMWLTRDAVCVAKVEGRQTLYTHHVVGALHLLLNKNEEFAVKCANAVRTTSNAAKKGDTEKLAALSISIPRVGKLVRANIPIGARLSGSTPADMTCALKCILETLMDECIAIRRQKPGKSEKPKLMNKHIYRAVHKNAVFCHLSGHLGFLGMGALPKHRDILVDEQGKVMKNKKGKAKVAPITRSDVKAMSKMNKLNDAHFVIRVAGVRREIKECCGDTRVSPASASVIHAAAEHQLGLILNGCREIMSATSKEEKTLRPRHINASMKIIDASFCVSKLPEVRITDKTPKFVVNDASAKRLALRAGIPRISKEACSLVRSIFSDVIYRLCNSSLVFLGTKRTLSYSMAVGGARALGIKTVLGEEAARKLKFKNPKVTSK